MSSDSFVRRSAKRRRVLLLSSLLLACSSACNLQSNIRGSASNPEYERSLVEKQLRRLRSLDPEERARGAFIAGALGPQASITRKALIGILGDSTNISRWVVGGETTPAQVAMVALGQIKDKGSFDPLAKGLHSPNAHLREAAATGLGHLGDTRAIPLLIEAQMDKEMHPDHVRFALVNLGLPALTALAECYVRESDLGRRRVLFWAMIDYGDLRPSGALREALVQILLRGMMDDDLSIRKAAAISLLTDLKDLRGLAPTIRHFAEARARGEKWHYPPLDWASARIGPAAIPDIIAEIQRPGSPLKQEMLQCLQRIGSPALEPLRKAYEVEKLEPFRKKIERVLVDLGDSSFFAHTLASLPEARDRERTRIISALGRMKDARAVEPLIDALGSGNEQQRIEVIRALGAIGDQKAVEPLVSIVRDLNAGYVRRVAADVLGILKNPVAIEALLDALSDNQYYIREAAAEALGNIGDARSFDRLLEMMTDESYWVRMKATKAVGDMRNPAAVKALVTALDDKSNLVRRNAIEGLQKMNWSPGNQEEEMLFLIARERWDEIAKIGPQAIEPMIRALKKEDFHFVIGVTRTLAVLTGEYFQDFPEKWEAWWESNKSMVLPSVGDS